MEKLEPILRQKFWILLGIGIIMTFVGWWMATGTMAAQIATRKTDIDGAFKKVPGGQIPNDGWSKQLADRNAEQERAVRFTARGLWERQKERMRWPDTVAEFAWQNGYRGEIALAGRENYRTAYFDDVHRVWESVRPFDQLSGTGIVEFGSQQAEALPQQTWGSLAPLATEMWDAQEDLWLLESILQAIVDVNGGANGDRLDASIHQIEKLELHGGVPAAQRNAGGGAPSPQGSASGSSPGGPGSMAHGSPVSMGGGGGGLGGLGGGARGSTIAAADFDWREEFGDDGSSSNNRQGGGIGGLGSMGSSQGGPSAGHMPGGAPGGPGATPGASSASKVRRYIDDDAALPYRTRGFYMVLLMDHRKIPSLISEITSSEKSAWPVEVVRVQMQRLHDDDVDGGTGGGGSSGPAIRSNNMFGPTRRPAMSGSSDGFGPQPFPVAGREGTGTGTVSPQAESAAAALAAAMQDPFMARVAIAGIITLYKEVKPEPVVTPPAVPAVPAAPATPATTDPAVPSPATDGVPMAEDPAASPTTPAEKPDAAAEKPEAKPDAPTEAKPEPAADSKPADPAAKPEETKPEGAAKADSTGTTR